MNTENFDSIGQVKTERLSSEAVARRRVLLKGVGKGVAALAATVPIQTLASQSVLTDPRLGTQHQCTVSGMQSGVHSATPTGTQTCMGYRPSRYELLSFWPGYLPGNPAHATNTVGIITFNETAFFATVFGGGPSSGNAARLFTIVSTGSPEPEQVWVTALLNAIKNPAGFNFPYTPSQVLAFYSSSQAAQALIFFRTYMQSVG